MFAHVHEHSPSTPSVLGDVNNELINLYTRVRDDLDSFIDETMGMTESYLKIPVEDKDGRKRFYYDLRQRYWDEDGSDSSLLYILMRLGFNGVWQTCKASHGLYGTPSGLLNHVRPQQVVDVDLIGEWSAALSSAEIVSGTYDRIRFNPDHAFIYLDPPYRGSFTSYGTVFGDKEQAELANWAMSRANEGATVALANRCVEGDDFFENLLPDAEFHYFDVVYTAGRRKHVSNGFEAKPAREFLAVIRP